VDLLALAQQSANQPAPSGPQGKRVRGAAAGAVIGAVADDAAKGAAIGACMEGRGYTIK
jgi:hypothetical protein